MQHLRALEDQSVYILREAYKHFRDLAMLWSMGKDSTVLLWLARKAFFGHVPFPLVHIDTGYEMPELIEYRAARVRPAAAPGFLLGQRGDGRGRAPAARQERSSVRPEMAPVSARVPAFRHATRWFG